MSIRLTPAQILLGVVIAILLVNERRRHVELSIADPTAWEGHRTIQEERFRTLVRQNHYQRTPSLGRN